jgi:hypothetical protein
MWRRAQSKLIPLLQFSEQEMYRDNQTLFGQLAGFINLNALHLREGRP